MFVLERADTMNDEAANRMLKTLEEPATFVHLILLTDRLGQVLRRSRSRAASWCASTRCRGADRRAAGGEGVDAAQAPARLALGDAGARARWRRRRPVLRADAEALARAALAGEPPGEPWRPLLERAERARGEAEERWPPRAERSRSSQGRDRKAIETEHEERARRVGRRARTEALDLGLS